MIKKADQIDADTLKKYEDIDAREVIEQYLLFNWEFETQRLINLLRDTGALMAYVDLFCGAGGTSTGMEEAEYLKNKLACVILGINHDREAIASHQANHPETLHMVEDIREVNLEPIARMIEAIRAALPYIKIVMWASMECTHFSKAKGGDSRDADSRSLAEELYRYDEAIKPDLLQMENVTEFRTWGPLMHKKENLTGISVKEWLHKMQHPEFGRLYSKNKKKWCNIKGLAYKKTKKDGIVPWMVPIPERKKEYFNAWVEHLKELGYTYQDQDINSANMGAYTTRNRFYGQGARNGMPIIFPEPTHAKDPEKYLRKYGKQLSPYKPVREVLDFSNKGESIFVPDRIDSPMTYKRINEGGIKFIAGGKKNYQAKLEEYLRFINGETTDTQETNTPEGDFPFIQNFHGGKESKATRVHSVDEPSRTIDTQNRYALTSFRFLTKHFSGHPESKSSSVDSPAGSITTIDHHAVVDVLPFLVQFNNNCDARDINEPCPTITSKEKFAMASFIQQRHSGNPTTKVISVDAPARTVTATGGNQELVQVLPFIFRQFGGGGGHGGSIDSPVGALMTYPKVNIVSPEGWIMGTSYDNVGRSVEEPAPTLLASRKHAYVVNPSYYGNSHSVEQPSPTVVARQDKAPLHLVQVEYEAAKAYYGIAVYESDCQEIKDLKLFMAIYGIKDIRMRMLLIPELLKIQGFPDGYILKGSQTNQKKFIGNSVEVKTARKMAECYGQYLTEEFQQKMVG